MFITIPLQLYYARRHHRTTAGTYANNKAALREMLRTDNGYTFFQLYLATELSLENLLFHEAVREWKIRTEHHTITDAQSAALAKAIFETYLNRKHFHVNVSFACSNAVAKSFATMGDQVKLDVFDEAQAQVFDLMVSILTIKH